MDFNKMVLDSLCRKAIDELEELHVTMLADLMSYVYIKNVKITKRNNYYTIFIDCIDLEKENLKEIKKVINGYNSNYITVNILPKISHIERPDLFPNKLTFEISIDMRKYRELISGNLFDQNR